MLTKNGTIFLREIVYISENDFGHEKFINSVYTGVDNDIAII